MSNEEWGTREAGSVGQIKIERHRMHALRSSPIKFCLMEFDLYCSPRANVELFKACTSNWLGVTSMVGPITNLIFIYKCPRDHRRRLKKRPTSQWRASHHPDSPGNRRSLPSHPKNSARGWLSKEWPPRIGYVPLIWPGNHHVDQPTYLIIAFLPN